jgi:hypothetical protein
MTASSPGAKTGTMTVSSDDPDSLAKTVLLSGRVIDHAAASVDSLVQTTVRTLDFSRSYAGGVRDTALRVHNAGWNAQRARLSVSNAVISGPDAARFSLVGGFSPSLVSGVAASLPLHFDATGTVSGQLYQATLTVSSADEPLPNAATQPDLVVTLRAYGPGTTDAPEALPTAVAFLPARPNPLSEGTMLRYELPRAMRISIEIYDLSGRRVATVEDGFREAGRHEVRWNAADDAGARVRSGLYFARFRSGGVESLQRLAVTP